MRRMDGDQFAIGLSITTEEALEGLFDWRNVDDDLEKAYSAASPNVAADQSLDERYSEMLDRGEKSVNSFIVNLKGKVAELKAEDMLEDRFPGYDFTIAAKQNQGVWDLQGVGPEGEQEILVQVKMGQADYADKVAERMTEALESHPDLLFAVSRDIYRQLHESYPELALKYGDRLISAGWDATEFTENVKEGVTKLAGTLGIDVPDSFGAALPFVAEIVMGVRLIWGIVSTERTLSGEPISDRVRVHGIRAMTMISKFGVTRVCTLVGGTAGGAGGTAIFPGIGSGVGSIVGGIAGVGGGMLFNRLLQPRFEEVVTKLVGGDGDDVFYLMNKQSVDRIGTSLLATEVTSKTLSVKSFDAKTSHPLSLQPSLP